MNRNIFSEKPLPARRPLFSNIEEMGPPLPDGSYVYNTGSGAVESGAGNSWNWNQAVDSGLDFIASLLNKGNTNAVPVTNTGTGTSTNTTTVMIAGFAALLVVVLVIYFLMKK